MGKLGNNQLGTNQLGSAAEFTGTADAETVAYSAGSKAYSSATGEVVKTAPNTDQGEVWQVVRGGSTVESDLFDVEVVDTANPFGDFAIAYLDDNSGDKFEQYERGTRVDFEVSTDNGLTFETRFSGFAVEAREQDQQGADTLEVECYSFDQFLRRNTVSEDQSGRTISAALENIVKNDTPVTWDASNVSVEDDKTLKRSYRGELVENVLKSLRQKSSNEDFGVNSDIEFFFTPSETENAPRDIDNSQWFNYDIPEIGKETVNQVTVFYNDGNENVTVDDGDDKNQLQDNLNTQDPVTVGTEVSRPDITDLDAAISVGERILNDRASTLTGTVTTFGLVDAQPGDVININIVPRGIDGDFRIAEIRYLWGRGETQLTIVEKKGEQDEVLVRLSDTVQRLETQDANRDGTSNRITSTQVGVVLPVSGDVDGTTYTTAKVTNTLRNQLRDGWGDGSNVDVAEIAVGNDGSTPTRSDSSLGNELARTSVSQSLPDTDAVLWEASLNESDVREVGLFDSSGNLLARATVPSTSFTSPVAVDFRINVNDDPATDPCVVTNDGQTAVRDVLADNSPNLPVDYAYGSDGSDPTESDTSLGNQVTTAPLDERNIQSFDTASEFSNGVTIGSNEPVFTGNSRLKHAQVNFLFEGEDMSLNTDTSVVSDSSYSDTEAAQVESTTSGFSDSFTNNYVIPQNDVVVGFRYFQNGSGSPEFDILIDGSVVAGAAKGALNTNSLEYQTFSANLGSDLSTGSHTVEFDVTTAGDNPLDIDIFFVRDSRFTYTDDNTVDSNNALSGPELFDNLSEITFDQATDEQAFDEARADQTWNDTSNDQFIALSNDGGNTFTQKDNTQSASVTFGGEDTQATTKVGLSRFANDTTTTPTVGDSGQTVDTHDLFALINTIRASDIGVADLQAIVEENTITNETLREAGELDSNGNLLTHCTFAEFTVDSDEKVVSSESFGWANA